MTQGRAVGRVGTVHQLRGKVGYSKHRGGYYAETNEGYERTYGREEVKHLVSSAARYA